MITQDQQAFLVASARAAKAAGHIFPAMAACEAALESTWGTSQLATDAHNLFGQKQSHPPVGESLLMPTREYLHNAWVTVQAVWKKYDAPQDCFADRMATLRRLAPAYLAYQQALKAQTPEDYIVDVSKAWSTDPQRAGKVLAIYHAHKSELDAAVA